MYHLIALVVSCTLSMVSSQDRADNLAKAIVAGDAETIRAILQVDPNSASNSAYRGLTANRGAANKLGRTPSQDAIAVYGEDSRLARVLKGLD